LTHFYVFIKFSLAEHTPYSETRHMQRNALMPILYIYVSAEEVD